MLKIPALPGHGGQAARQTDGQGIDLIIMENLFPIFGLIII